MDERIGATDCNGPNRYGGPKFWCGPWSEILVGNFGLKLMVWAVYTALARNFQSIVFFGPDQFSGLRTELKKKLDRIFGP